MQNRPTIHIAGWRPNFAEKYFQWVSMEVVEGRIERVYESAKKEENWRNIQGERWILPGLVDAHVHIESSMLTPARFAEMVLRKGTVATVSDPHEIANVMGEAGLKFMHEETLRTPVKFHFTMPSCVPATPLETAGAVLDATRIKCAIDQAEYVALGEMMNYPGIIQGDPEVMKKIQVAREKRIPVDGHAPGVTGKELQAYVQAGITTDHECTSMDEAREKIAQGMHILIREGSAAKNFEALYALIDEYPDRVMLCCDDIHPDDLCEYHLDQLITRGLRKGLDFFHLYPAASLNPIDFYELDVGKLTTGDRADLIVATWQNGFRVDETWIHGEKVFDINTRAREVHLEKPVNRFDAKAKQPADFILHGNSGNYRVIGVIDGELITRQEIHPMQSEAGIIESDCKRDILKIVLINRYRDEKPAVGLIHGFGFDQGAIASSIAHDSHHLVVVGVSDEDLAEASNRVIRHRGGIAVADHRDGADLPLPVAGLMSQLPGEEVARQYKLLTQRARKMGSSLTAPFMTLSFMALLVIPELKIGEKGLFDGQAFTFVENRIM